MQERIVAPMDHANDLLATWPYLTRLYTTISPHEMLSDPVFAEVEGLADVPRAHGGLRTSDCCEQRMRLPGGREVLYTDGAWPTWDTSMPWAERISEYQPDGPPAQMVDRSAEIDGLLAAHNASIACEDPAPPGGGSGTTGTANGTSGGAGSSSSGDEGGVDAQPADPAGCACAADRRAPGGLALLPLLLLVAGRRRWR